MANNLKEKITKKDIIAFAESVEKSLYEATGDEVNIINAAIGYPLRLDQKVDKGDIVTATPGIAQLYSNKSLILDNKDPQQQVTEVSILTPDKQTIGCGLTYRYRTYYYKDPNSDQVNKINIPDLDYTSLSDFLEFAIKFFGCVEDIKRYIYILLTTNTNIVAQKWRGTGFELYEKIMGTSTSLGLTRRQLESQNLSPDELSKTLEDHEIKKRTASIELAHSALSTHKFINGLQAVKQAYEEYAKAGKLSDGSELISNIETTPLNPIEVNRNTETLVEINGTSPVNGIHKLNQFI